MHGVSEKRFPSSARVQSRPDPLLSNSKHGEACAWQRIEEYERESRKRKLHTLKKIVIIIKVNRFLKGELYEKGRTEMESS